MEVLQGLTDDQKALLGCGVALLVCGGIMVLSHTIRQWVSGSSSTHTYRYQSRTAEANDGQSEHSPDRKAA